MSKHPDPIALMYYRRSRGLSAEEVAARVGMSTSTIRAYERGARRPPADVLVRLADVLGAPLTVAPPTLNGNG